MSKSSEACLVLFIVENLCFINRIPDQVFFFIIKSIIASVFRYINDFLFLGLVKAYYICHMKVTANTISGFSMLSSVDNFQMALLLFFLVML